MGVSRAPEKGEVGQEMKKVHMEIFREYYWSLPFRRAEKKNGLVSGGIWGL